MMNELSRQRRSRVLLFGLLFGGLLMAAFWSWRGALAAEEQLNDARYDAEEAIRMSGDIVRLRTAPRIASLELESPDEVSRKVMAAIRGLDRPSVSLRRLSPERPMRLARSEYQLRATNLELENIRLSDLARFADDLVQSSHGLQVRDITITEPRTAAGSEETWLARLTITQMIYSPRKTGGPIENNVAAVPR